MNLIRASGTAVKLQELQVALAASGACTNLNAAKTYVLSAPYLEAAGRGILLRSAQGARWQPEVTQAHTLGPWR